MTRRKTVFSNRFGPIKSPPSASDWLKCCLISAPIGRTWENDPCGKAETVRRPRGASNTLEPHFLQVRYVSSGLEKQQKTHKKRRTHKKDLTEKGKKGWRVSCDACWQEVDGQGRSIGEGSPLIVQLAVIRWWSFKACTRYVTLHSWQGGDEEGKQELTDPVNSWGLVSCSFFFSS